MIENEKVIIESNVARLKELSNIKTPEAGEEALKKINETVGIMFVGDGSNQIQADLGKELQQQNVEIDPSDLSKLVKLGKIIYDNYLAMDKNLLRFPNMTSKNPGVNEEAVAMIKELNAKGMLGHAETAAGKFACREKLVLAVEEKLKKAGGMNMLNSTERWSAFKDKDKEMGDRVRKAAKFTATRNFNVDQEEPMLFLERFIPSPMKREENK